MRENWIVACSGSDWDNIYTYRVSGTLSEVKAFMMSIINKDVDENLEYDDVDYRTRNADEIELREDNIGEKYLYGVISWYNSHADYIARKEKRRKNLKGFDIFK